MIEYNKINFESSDSRLNRLKSAVKNQTGVTLRMSMKILSKETIYLMNYYYQHSKK